MPQKVNADFYPLALEPYTPTADGVKHFPRAADGFLTKEEFVTLYDICANLLHTRNPFSTEDLVIQLGYSAEQWVSRIQKLLSIHTISLVSGNRWVIVIPKEGKIQGCAASPIDAESFKASSALP